MNTLAYRPRWSSDELEAVRRVARRFFEHEAVPLRAEWESQGHADRAFWRRAAEVGLLTPSIPAPWGVGGGLLHEFVVAEEQARALVTGWGHVVHSIAAHYILAYGTEAQKQRWLPGMASGEIVGAIAMTEPGAGSDVQAIATHAARDEDHYIVSGTKTFITNGLVADLIVLAVKTDPSRGGKGISLLAVETAGLDGFARGAPLHKIGMNAQDTNELFFRDARVPVADRIGREGEGFALLMKQLPFERLLIAIAAVATMERAIGETVAYTKQRSAFGKALFEQQNTRFTLAECHTAWRVCRSFVDECIELMARGELDVPTAAMAKWWSTEQQGRVIDECLQLHGGYGYILDYPIARMFADARVGRIYGGANEIMKELVARAL